MESTVAAPEATTTHEQQRQQIKALFPNLDDSVIDRTLLRFDYDLEMAVDHLLTAPPSDAEAMNSARHAPSSDGESDEAMARRLNYEQLAQYHAHSTASTNNRNVPYKPYVASGSRRRAGSGASGDGVGHSTRSELSSPRPRDELDQLTEQFERLASKGSVLAKQGASTIKTGFMRGFDFLKDELQKLDQPPPPPPLPDRSNLPPLPHDHRSTTSIVPPLLPRPLPSAPYSTSPLPARPASTTTSPTLGSRRTLVAETCPSDVVDVDSVAAHAPATAAIVDPKKDFSSIGLLPRQSVALTKSTTPHLEQDEDDDLEYVRNPFEDDT